MRKGNFCFMPKDHFQVRCLPCWARTGEGFKQIVEWLAFEDKDPPETETVLVASESSLAFGYVSLEGDLIIEHTPWGQEECQEAGAEFLYWMPLPENPIWLKYRNELQSGEG
jgi:hypothetical protein